MQSKRQRTDSDLSSDSDTNRAKDLPAPTPDNTSSKPYDTEKLTEEPVYEIKSPKPITTRTDPPAGIPDRSSNVDIPPRHNRAEAPNKSPGAPDENNVGDDMEFEKDRFEQEIFKPADPFDKISFEDK